MTGRPDDVAARPEDLSNDDLLAAVDRDLLELERRLLRYARQGPELRDMADEGLILAVRAGARLRQAQSATAHAAGHLQILAVGEWQPRSTNPTWDADPRVQEDAPPGPPGSPG